MSIYRVLFYVYAKENYDSNMLCICSAKRLAARPNAQHDSVCAARDFTLDARSLLESFICRFENIHDCTPLECDNSILTDKLLSL